VISYKPSEKVDTYSQFLIPRYFLQKVKEVSAEVGKKNDIIACFHYFTTHVEYNRFELNGAQIF